MEKIIKNLEKYYKKLSKDDYLGGKILSIQRFNEVLLRLQIRKDEVTNSEKKLCKWEEREESLEELQTIFINKTESFHQQIYAIISTFSMLLNYVTSNDFKKGMPIKSNKKFLIFLSNKYKKLENDIRTLELSRSFGTKFDHIQQNPLFDWLTESLEERCTIVFF
ncbi:MAG: hypothetical protein WC075_02435 [Dehalococcoidales bacterium]